MIYRNIEQLFDRRQHRSDPEYWSARSDAGMVVTAHYLATDAGLGVLNRGGNAFDAAVAASLALSVCESAGSGLGGMGMMLAYHADTERTFTIEGACRAPAAATPEKIDQAERNLGYRSVAVPGLVSVLNHALNNYGLLACAEVLAPAIHLARNGYPLTHMQRKLINTYKKHLRSEYVRELYLKKDGRSYAPGYRFRQLELAATLETLSANGLEDFYTGEIADQICQDMAVNDGFISHQDMRSILIPRESVPIQTPFDGAVAVSIGPPAGALSLMQMLAAANKIEPGKLHMDEPDGVVRVARIIRRARKERRKYRLKIGSESLQDAARWLDGDKLARVIRAATGETSHLCVADIHGNWVSMTQSIERSFGAGVGSPALGFLYNGYLRAFKIRNKRHPHFLRPGVPARSNAAPTMIIKEGRPVLTIGSTGSERMQSGIFEVLLRLRTESPFEAVHGPRLHCSPEGMVMIEADRFAKQTIDALAEEGFQIMKMKPYEFSMGGLQLLVRMGTTYTGVTEPRRDGMALGL